MVIYILNICMYFLHFLHEIWKQIISCTLAWSQRQKIAMMQFGSSILNDVEATRHCCFFRVLLVAVVVLLDLSHQLIQKSHQMSWGKARWCVVASAGQIWSKHFGTMTKSQLWRTGRWKLGHFVILIESGCSRRRNRAWKLMGSLGDRKTRQGDQPDRERERERGRHGHFFRQCLTVWRWERSEDDPSVTLPNKWGGKHVGCYVDLIYQRFMCTKWMFIDVRWCETC